MIEMGLIILMTSYDDIVSWDSLSKKLEEMN